MEQKQLDPASRQEAALCYDIHRHSMLILFNAF